MLIDRGGVATAGAYFSDSFNCFLVANKRNEKIKNQTSVDTLFKERIKCDMIRYLLGKVVVFIHTLATNQNSYMDFLFVRQLAKRSTNNHFQLASAR